MASLTKYQLFQNINIRKKYFKGQHYEKKKKKPFHNGRSFINQGDITIQNIFLLII